MAFFIFDLSNLHEKYFLMCEIFNHGILNYDIYFYFIESFRNQMKLYLFIKVRIGPPKDEMS